MAVGVCVASKILNSVLSFHFYAIENKCNNLRMKGSFSSMYKREFLSFMKFQCDVLGFPNDGGNIPCLEAALEVCNRVYRDHKVYLFNAVLVERELWKTQAKTSQDAGAVTEVIAQLERE